MRKAACLLMLVAGCGAQIEQNVQRSIVDDAFDRCRDFGIFDEDTEGFIVLMRSFRDLGFSRSELIVESLVSCDNPASAIKQLACQGCMLSVVEVVFAEN